MRIGLAQMNIIFEDKTQNEATCLSFFAQAQQQGVDLLLFPEMTLTGFSMHTAHIGEQENTSPTIDFFRQAVKAYGVAACFGFVALGGAKAENRCIILDKQGEVSARYSKLHPFSYGAEAAHFQGGNQPAFCELMGIPISPTICYDLRFPELYQAISKQAKLITVIANWPTIRGEHWVALLKARAIENQCFIAAVNGTGIIRKEAYPGLSMVIDPYGKVLTELTEEECLLTADIDPEVADTYRREFPLKADRREDLYKIL